nr:PREDICTED: NADH dehydrogenase [ubiquinone] 1 beta subcomplex subunit 3 [Bemisia tabaci]
MGGGHGHGDGHHHAVVGETPLTKVPDWRIYKVEDVPDLMRMQRTLAQKGLKDPWARNHVWRYIDTDYRFWGKPPSTNFYVNFLKRIATGLWPWGIGATVITITCERLYEKLFLSDDGDEHGHGHKRPFRICP